MRAPLVSVILVTALVPAALLAADPPGSASSHSVQDFCSSSLQLDDGAGMATYTLDLERSEGPSYGDAPGFFSTPGTKVPAGEVSCYYQGPDDDGFTYEISWLTNDFTQRQGDNGQLLATLPYGCSLIPAEALGPQWLSPEHFASTNPTQHGWTEQSNRTLRAMGMQAVAKIENQALSCDQPFNPPCPASYGDHVRAVLFGPLPGTEPSTSEQVDGWYSSLCLFAEEADAGSNPITGRSVDGTFVALAWAHVATSTPHPTCRPDAETAVLDEDEYGPEDKVDVYLSDDKAAGVAVILEARNGPSDDPDDQEFVAEDPELSRALARDVLTWLEAVSVDCDASPGTVAPAPTRSLMRAEQGTGLAGSPGTAGSPGSGTSPPAGPADGPPGAPACLPARAPLEPSLTSITLDTYLGAGEEGWTWTPGSSDAGVADLGTVLGEGQAFATQSSSAANLTLQDAPDTGLAIADLQLSPGGIFCWTDATRALDGQGGTVVSVTLTLEQGLLYWRTSDQWPEIPSQGPGPWHIVHGANTVVLQGTEAIVDTTPSGDDVTVYMRDGQGEILDTATGATRTTLTAGTTTEIRDGQAEQRPMSEEDWQAAAQSVETQAGASDGGLPITWIAIAGSVAVLGGYWWYTGRQRAPRGPPPGYQQHGYPQHGYQHPPYQGAPPGDQQQPYPGQPGGQGHGPEQPPPELEESSEPRSGPEVDEEGR